MCWDKLCAACESEYTNLSSYNYLKNLCVVLFYLHYTHLSGEMYLCKFVKDWTRIGFLYLQHNVSLYFSVQYLCFFSQLTCALLTFRCKTLYAACDLWPYERKAIAYGEDKMANVSEKKNYRKYDNLFCSTLSWLNWNYEFYFQKEMPFIHIFQFYAWKLS